MQNGNVVETAEILVRTLAKIGHSDSAKIINDLVRYTKALDNNQKSLIKLILKYKRENKELYDLCTKMYIMMNQGQKNIVSSWLEEGDE